MSSISNQASAHSFCQESVSLVCSSAHLQLTNQEIGKSIYFFLRSWKEKKRKGRQKHRSKFNKAKLNSKTERALKKVSKSFKAPLLLCKFRKAVWTRNEETSLHKGFSKAHSFLGDTSTMVLDGDRAGTKQAKYKCPLDIPTLCKQTREQNNAVAFPFPWCAGTCKTGSYSLQHSLKNCSGDSLERSQESP